MVSLSSAADAGRPSVADTTAHMPGAVRGDLERWRSGVGGGGGGAASAVDSKVVAEGMRQAFGGDPDTGRWRLTERSRYQLRRPHRSARPATDV